MNGKRSAEGPAAAGAAGSNGKQAKRSRVSRACDQCRASRERCNGDQPCQTCTSQNRSCTFNAAPKKRGIQPNYIRTLELTLTWLFQHFPETEVRLTSELPRTGSGVNGLLRGKATESAEALHLAWRNSLVCKQIDQLLSGDTIDTYGQMVTSPAISSNASTTQVTASNQSPLQAMPSTSSGWPDHTEITAPANILPTAGRAQIHQGETDLLKLPENALMLLEHYFAFTHAWLPMLEKSSVLRLLYAYPDAGAMRDELLDADNAELWSIMALAAAQLSDTNADRIRLTAEGFIPSANENAAYKTPHIRAMMLLALIDATNERMLAAWLRIGLAVSLLLLFRILESLNVTEKWCKHVHSSAFVIETAIAQHLSAPTHLRSTYIEAMGPIEEDGIDEYDLWRDPTTGQQLRSPTRAFSTLNRLVKHFVVLQNSADDSGRGVSQSAGSAVFFSLLQNATLQQDRLQPSVLVASHENQHERDATVPWTAMPADVDAGANIGNTQALTATGWTQDSAATTSGFQYPMISPDVPSKYAPLANKQSTHDLWTTSPSTSQAADLGFMYGDAATGDTDIFEQFDALLERQDSTQQSQFYQNLGFAPDLELAQFFGADYQPSDPMLAYLNPSLYGIDQSGQLMLPDTG